MDKEAKKTVKDRRKRLVLAGNPNVGKSAIFGLLTGKYATISNYPGTTVEMSYGNLEVNGRKFIVIDTPGVNNLIPMSEDEKVTRDVLLNEPPSLVVQVSDAKNLRRTLILTLQLIEMGFPLVLTLNMEDEARERGLSIDFKKLSELLGVDVIGTIATEKKGIGALKSAVEKPRLSSSLIVYDPLLEEYIAKVSALLPEAGISRRSLALMLLSGDKSLRNWLKVNLEKPLIEQIEKLRDECQSLMNVPIGAAINETRIKKSNEITGTVLKKTVSEGGQTALFIGRISIHPIWGLPILLLVLFGLYEFVGVFGAGTLVNLVEKTIFGEYLNPMFKKVVELLVPVQFLRELLVGEYGILTMALTYAIGIILPITTTFFIAFAILEDSGYLPRLAIMSNRVFNIMGLSGKAVLPMVLGLGCGTMAVMTTRILETRRDRIIATFLLALAVPCAAQLGVILGMLGALSWRAAVIWTSGVVGVLLFSGFLASKIVKGEKSDFFLEIPPIRKPSAANIAVKTTGRVVWYLKEAVPLFMLGTFILFLFNKLALLNIIQSFTSPVIVTILGLPEKTTEAFLIGFLRRDYGAAGLFAMAKAGLLDPVQSVVSLMTITLFIPCLAHFFMMIKERGLRMSLLMIAVIFPAAIFFGGLLNWILRYLNVSL